MTVKLVSDTMSKSLKKIQQDLATLPKELYDFWVKQTPIQSGNARRKTRLEKNTIAARYPYAQRLDQGWSNQAPDGMSKPTEKELSRLLDKKIRK